MDMDSIEAVVGKLKKENPFISQVDVAYRIIQQGILSNQLPAGEKINQEYYANVLNMSRTPIREALIQLEKDGYVEKNDKAGYLVYQIKLKDFVDFFEFRIQLESYAAYLAARSITGEQLAGLKQNVEDFIKACDRDNLSEMRRLDGVFHDMIIRACDNPYVMETHRWMLGRRKLYIGYLERAGRLAYAKKWHVEIYKAIASQDEDGAREAMRQHLKYYLRTLYRIM